MILNDLNDMNDMNDMSDMNDMNDDDASESTLRDKWIDEADGASWFVSNQVINDYDEEWDDDDEWDQINEEIVTLRGNQITRKCLHMWGHRLCLCQFLNWIDSRKYKCLPSALAGAGAGAGAGNGNIGMNEAATYKEYHSYGAPDITHHITLNHRTRTKLKIN
eukprot:TRINITY_DN10973_c0_g1_i1.p1 TRINITY_DN10973_c0_g1~~TRINITY_DN10973_c0_g1_i1.p1  ORF type:complete len:163 (-),score=44.09 TRINITY_DN10973_c0_g1_i1:293-781(-)